MSRNETSSPDRPSILVRFFLFCFVLLAILGLFVVVFAMMKRSRFMARVEEIRSAGDPASLVELQPSPGNALENAATHLAPIQDVVDELSSSVWPLLHGDDFSWRQGLSAERLAEIDTLFSAHPNLFGKLERASLCRRYGASLDYTLPPTEFALPVSQDARSIARLSDSHARFLAASNQFDEAVEACVWQLRLCRLQNEFPMIIGWMVNNACRNSMLEDLAGILQSADLSAETHRAIEDELAKHDAMDHFVWALKSERALGIDLMQAQLGFIGTVSGMSENYLDVMNQQIDAGAASEHVTKNTVWIPGTGLTAIVTPALQNVRGSMNRTRATMRCLRVLNAIEQAGAEGVGNAVAIEALGLPDEATMDPYNGKRLTITSNKAGWIVYAVGSNQIDDGGSVADEMDVGVSPL